MSASATGKVVFGLALRNFLLHRVKTLIIGTIMFFGAYVFVVGTALLDSLETSMARSIVSSLAGHMQVYSKDAKDELALFGGLIMGVEDIGRIDDFAGLRSALLGVDNVAAVVPMGIDQGTVNTGNELDRALESLREAVRAGDADKTADRVARVRRVAGSLASELEKKRAVSRERDKIETQIRDLERVGEDSFWTELAERPEQGLLFLDARVAPLAEGNTEFYLRYVGTDLQAFQENFDRFEIVRGRGVPPGTKGMLLSERVFEKEIKHIVARELDALARAVAEEGRSIEGDPVLEAKRNVLVSAYDSILFQLGESDIAAVEAALRAALPGEKGDLKALLRAFLRVDDANVAARRAVFYEHVAPRIRLYEFGIGDMITVRTYSRSGFLNSANVRIFGTYRFKGLENSDLAGSHNLVDLVTFRELYGHMTAEQKAELEHIRSEIDAKEVTRENAEAALFGGDEALVEEVEAPEVDLLARVAEGSVTTRSATAADDGHFPPEELARGLALNAAVVLKDASRLPDTLAEVGRVVAPLGLKVVSWQEASGLIGQFIIVVRGVLYVAIVIIFVVALVIINNSMVMAMQDRVAEIGTMRAIGAQRSFVMTVFLGESVVLGLVAGILGAAVGVASILAMGSVGVPAIDDVSQFLFGGSRFYPGVGFSHFGFAVGLILAIGLVSTAYPARIATSIQPVVAMRGKGE
jgi:ABC-type lipoprotein release transport system permease subunit